MVVKHPVDWIYVMFLNIDVIIVISSSSSSLFPSPSSFPSSSTPSLTHCSFVLITLAFVLAAFSACSLMYSSASSSASALSVPVQQCHDNHKNDMITWIIKWDE